LEVCLEACKGVRIAHAAHDDYFHDRGVNVQAARASGHLSVSESPLLAAFTNPAPRNSGANVAESPVLGESPARPVVQPRKLPEAAKETLDEVWADAIYALALPFNFLEHPSESQFAQRRSTPPPIWYAHSGHAACRVVPASFDVAGEVCERT
jgi:hypothetical protein